MPTPDQLDRICIVLLRARNPSNIGAVARAMHDFGFRRLRVVNQFPVPFQAARSAVDASAVLTDATHHETVADAVADCTLVVGTTAVGERNLEHELFPLAKAAPRLNAEMRRSDNAGRIALLFGSEKTGLSNEELSHCHWLLTIPMQEYADVRHASMNLGQAVAVCLYELVRDGSPSPTRAHAPIDLVTRPNEPNPAGESQPSADEPATAASLERLTALLSEVMAATEYTRRHPANTDPAPIRRLVRRMALTEDDSAVWMGILRQVLWKLGAASRRP